MNAVSGLRKAAVLLVALGEQASAAVFPHLDDAEIRELNHQIEILGRDSMEDAQAVLEEFYMLALARRYVMQGGVEYAKKVLRESLPADRCRLILDRITKHLDQGPGFHNLRQADPRLLSKIISREHPQTIAFILSHLDVGKAADTLSNLPAELQVEVARRMANLEEISPEVVKKVSSVLNSRIATMAGSTIEVEGVKTVAEMLNRMGRSESRNILGKLELENPELAAHIRQLMFVFDDVQYLPDKAVQEILKRCDKSVLAVALKGAAEELREKFFRNLSSRAVETLREEMSFIGPVRVSEVTAAQSSLTEIVRQLEEEGVIVLVPSDEDEYIT